MFKKRKLNLRFIFTTALASALIVLAALLTLFFLDEIDDYAYFAYKENKKSILDKTKLLLRANARRAAKYYSAYFNNLVTSTRLIAQQVGNAYGEAVDDSTIMDGLPVLKLINAGNTGVYINNFTYSDKAIAFIPWDKSWHVGLEQYTSPSKLIKYLFFKLQPHVKNIWDETNAPYMHDAWLNLKTDEGYYVITFPNLLRNIKPGSKNWKNAIKISDSYYDKLSPLENPDKKTLWTTVHDSVSGRRIQTIMAPIYTEKGIFVGGAGISLIVDSSLVDIIGLDPDKNESRDGEIKDVIDNFAFVMNNENDILAFPIKYADLFSLPENKVKKSKLFYNGSLYDSEDIHVQKIVDKIKNNESGVFDIEIKDNDYIFTYSKLENGWILVEVVPEKGLLSSVRKSSNKFMSVIESIYLKILLATLILLVISILFCLVVFSKYIIRPIQYLCSEADDIGSGKFDISVVKGGVVEIGQLSLSFTYLLKNLKKYTENLKKEIKKRLSYETEVKVAGDIQLSLLPKVSDKFNNDLFSISAILFPAKDASGDFYDFFYLDKDKIAILIADVSGKGISAAFFMAIAKTVIKSATVRRYREGPGNALSLANNMLNHDNDKLMFVTAFLAFYEISTGKLTYSNAGHHSAVKLNNQGMCTEFGMMDNVALGIIPDTEYCTKEIQLDSNDRVVLYTDGIVEAVNSRNEEFGEERFKKLLLTNTKINSQNLGNKIVNTVRDFEEGKKFDDITLLILERK